MSNPKKNIENVRVDYDKSLIDFKSIDKSPFDLFDKWIEQAFVIDKDNANAFVLSTVSNNMIPSSRVVLMRGFSEKGLVYSTLIMIVINLKILYLIIMFQLISFGLN